MHRKHLDKLSFMLPVSAGPATPVIRVVLRVRGVEALRLVSGALADRKTGP